jgi:hypothetical protein
MADLRPMFGAHKLQPEGLSAVYGGRWIVDQDGYVDLVPDRHGTEGDDAALLAWLNGDGGALGKARATACRLLRDYVIRTREASPTILFQDHRGVIVADTNASAGYLYVTGWLFDDLPPGHPTRGLESVWRGQ